MMKRHRGALLLFLLCLVAGRPAAAQGGFVLDCDELPCAAVLPGAARFEAVEEGPFQMGFGPGGEQLGWVALSTDVVDIIAYSGQPMVTLVGLDMQGVIAGARIVHHTEPILLVGIPERALSDFVDLYTGIPAVQRVVVGTSRDPDAVEVDAISGATVTALAQNQTILDTARELGAAVGVVRFDAIARGEFIDSQEIWSWPRMERARVFGRLTVSEAEMGVPNPSGAFVDLYFTLADAPHIGRSLLGDGDYNYLMSRRQDGEHLLVVLGRGSNSFKGSGFVRGGVFDRVRVEQGMRSLMFRDADYFNFPVVRAEGAPRFREGAVFFTRDGRIDPGAPYDLVFVGSRYDGRGGFSREFQEFRASHRLPRSVYRIDGRAEGAYWKQAWYNQGYRVAVLVVILLAVAGLFLQRTWLTGDIRRLKRLHLASLLASFFVLGLWLRAQPSITQIFTLLDGIVHEWRMGLFLSEPLIFVSWIFIAVVVIAWGRGVFCGWVCPYGAMSELFYRVGKAMRLPSMELPGRVHQVARHGRYVILLVLIIVFFYSASLGELLAEVEPFKSTFFIAPWTREYWYFGWWLLLAGLSFVWFRPFCRYLCPLGAALALPSSLRLSGPRRRQFCSSCKICTKGCEPRAIADDGVIDRRECLGCMECEATYRSPQVCPPLVGLERLRKRAADAGRQPDTAREKQLLGDARDIPVGPFANWKKGGRP